MPSKDFSIFVLYTQSSFPCLEKTKENYHILHLENPPLQSLFLSRARMVALESQKMDSSLESLLKHVFLFVVS
jgi:hypothetical protein